MDALPSLLLASLADELGKTASDVGEKFGFNTQLFISQIVSFCVVAGLLYLFAYKPVLQMLEKRRQKIEEGLASAEKMKKELAEAESRIQQMMREAGEKADGVIAEARTSAETVAQRKTQEAAAEAQQIVENAREATKLEAAKIKEDIKKEFGHLIVETTAKVTGKILTAEDQKRLNEEAAREIAKV